jgi:hypothetical protein|nr:MAG TPA: hypothetical protein [Caudoviricetes sp.]
MSTQPLDTSKLPMALAPLHVLLNRLTGHTDKGRMLYGLRLELSPAMARVQGKKDYPVLRLLVPALGCRPSDAGSGKRAAQNRVTEESAYLTPADNLMTVTFQLETSAESGWFGPAVPRGRDRCALGHLDWQCLVMDAMETDWTRGDDFIDMRLCKTLQSPFSIELTDDPNVNESSIASLIVVNMTQSFLPRGSRYSTIV